MQTVCVETLNRAVMVVRWRALITPMSAEPINMAPTSGHFLETTADLETHATPLPIMYLFVHIKGLLQDSNIVISIIFNMFGYAFHDTFMMMPTTFSHFFILLV